MINVRVAFFTGIFIGMAIIFSIWSAQIFAYNDAINLCEKDLPRTEACVITAVPKIGGK